MCVMRVMELETATVQGSLACELSNFRETKLITSNSQSYQEASWGCHNDVILMSQRGPWHVLQKGEGRGVL